jgi:hypothetical protein
MRGMAKAVQAATRRRNNGGPFEQLTDFDCVVSAGNSFGVEPKIRRVACPGLGTGAGKVPPEEAARQMALGYQHYLNPPTLLSWPYAKDRDSYIRVSPRLPKRPPKK